MKFALDTMLGHLLTWLRLLGFDTIYIREMDDLDILSFSKKDGRILVTRDRELVEKSRKSGVRAVLLEGVETVECLLKISEETGVTFRFSPEQSRCPTCNGSLSITSMEPLRWRCIHCGKEFWVGRHWKNIRKVLKKLEENTLG